LRLLSTIYRPACFGLSLASKVASVGGEYELTERGAAHMANQSEEFHPHAARRLFLAVVNQAIFDVLEKKKEAKAAEQWLLSEDFDNFTELLS
jgi:hypothetical protein